MQTWGDEWLQKVAPLTAAPHTVGGYRSNLERHVYPRLGNIGLVDLTGKHVLDFQHQLLTSGLKVASVKVARRPLTTMLNVAVRFGFRDSNPTMSVPHQKDPRRGPVGTRLTKYEAGELRAAARQASSPHRSFRAIGGNQGASTRENVDCGGMTSTTTPEKFTSPQPHRIDKVWDRRNRITELVRKEPKSVTGCREHHQHQTSNGPYNESKVHRGLTGSQAPIRVRRGNNVREAKNGTCWPRNLARSVRRFVKARSQMLLHMICDWTFANHQLIWGANPKQISETRPRLSALPNPCTSVQVPVLTDPGF